METAAHLDLKQAAARWAFQQGYRAVACEVTAPRTGYRVDVAAYRSYRLSDQRPPIVAVFECKQSRPDFRRHAARRVPLESVLRELMERKETLEHLLKIHYPTLCRNDVLFPEYAHFECPHHRGYRLLLRKIEAVHRLLPEGTKFECMAERQTANLHWLVVPSGLVRPEHLPLGWGLLERSADSELVLRRAPQLFMANQAVAWLERIAQAATRSVAKREWGIEFTFPPISKSAARAQSTTPGVSLS